MKEDIIGCRYRKSNGGSMSREAMQMTTLELQEWIKKTWEETQDIAQPKQWVGLTAYEIQEIHFKNPHWGNFACAIEAKLKEKNT